MSSRWITLAVLLAGCRDKDTGITDTGQGEQLPAVTLTVTGQAPWDPMLAEDEVTDERLAPVVDGAELDEALSTSAGVYAWRAELEPGEHTIEAPEGTTSAAITHTVLPYGRGEDFDAQDIIGVPLTMDLDSPWIAAPEGLGDILLTLIDGVWLEVVSVQEEEAVFEVYTRADSSDGSYPICRALRARGTLSATGELTWETAALDNGKDPLLRNLTLRAGFLPDGSAAGGIEGVATLHTAQISRELSDAGTIPGGASDESALCELLLGFGEECYDCLDDGPLCVDIAFHAGVMSPWDEALPEDPPDCGIDADDLGPIKCELPDFSCAAGFFGLLGLTGMLRRRQR